jgi:hypothetical protein
MGVAVYADTPTRRIVELKPKRSFAPLFPVVPSLTRQDDLFFVTDPRICQALDAIGGDDGGQFLLKRPHPNTKSNREEYATIARLRERGWTLQRIGERFGVRRQRIHQVLKTCTGQSDR